MSRECAAIRDKEGGRKKRVKIVQEQNSQGKHLRMGSLIRVAVGRNRGRASVKKTSKRGNRKRGGKGEKGGGKNNSVS